MLSALVWTIGAAGMLAFVVFTVSGLAVFVVDDWWSGAAGFAGLALCGAGVNLAAERWLAGERRRRYAEQLRVHALWAGSEITAGLRWSKCLLTIGLAIAMLVAGSAELRSSQPDTFIAGVVTSVIFAPMLALLLLFVVAAVRAGYVLRLDARGIHHCSGTTVPWRDVWSVQWQRVRFRLPGAQPVDSLVAVLQPHATPGGYGGGVLRRLIGPRTQDQGTRMVFGIGGLTAAPELLLHAAGVIAGRAGVPTAEHRGFLRAGVRA